MTDEAILELFNETLRAQAQLAAEYKHVAVEVPLGSPRSNTTPTAANGRREAVCCAASSATTSRGTR